MFDEFINLYILFLLITTKCVYSGQYFINSINIYLTFMRLFVNTRAVSLNSPSIDEYLKAERIEHIINIFKQKSIMNPVLFKPVGRPSFWKVFKIHLDFWKYYFSETIWNINFTSLEFIDKNIILMINSLYLIFTQLLVKNLEINWC